MFRTLATLLNNPTLAFPPPNPGQAPPEKVFEIHPYQLSQWLEAAWNWNSTVGNWLGTGFPPGSPPYLGDTGVITRLQLPDAPDPVLTMGFLRSGIPQAASPIPGFTVPPAPGQNLALPLGLPWEHAVYALIIESTGVYEILAEVTRRFVVGETLEPPGPGTQQWLRATEELFFRDPPLYHIAGITSQFRPDTRTSPAQPVLAAARHGPAAPAAAQPQRRRRAAMETGHGRRQYPLPRTMAGIAPAGMDRLRERHQHQRRQADR